MPDILANAGGVIVSYFEWVQNRLGFKWTKNRVYRRSDSIIKQAFNNVFAISRKYNISLRTAAYIAAIDKVSRTYRYRDGSFTFQKMMRIHKEGRFFLGILFISLIVINLFIYYFFLSIFFISSLLSFSVFLFFLQFFRNPKIDKRERENSIISPANGKVVFIGESYGKVNILKKKNFRYQFLCLHLMYT